MKFLLLAAAVAVGMACAAASADEPSPAFEASRPTPPTPGSASGPGAGVQPVFAHPNGSTQLLHAATAPLDDLNLVRSEIPPVLLAARKTAYLVPADHSCEAMAAEIAQLDAALGPDLDAPAAAKAGLAERGQREAGQAATSALRSTTEGLVPFRGWVRKLSGADKHSAEVEASVTAGTVRRAFLKGMGQGYGCKPPSAPRQADAAASRPMR